MAEDINKKYPTASDEIAQIMGFKPSEEDAELDVPEVSTEEIGGHAPANLPLSSESHTVTKVVQHPHAHVQEEPEEGPDMIYEGVDFRKPIGRHFIFTFLQTSAPFFAVFIVGVVLYMFFFSSFNFGSLFNSRSTKTSTTVKDTALTDLEKQSMPQYQAWIGHFYYDVSDPNVLDPNTDNSGNGLVNFEKYLLNLNPRSYDTLGLGMADSEALAKGINPLTGMPLTGDQKKIVDNYFDMEAVMNRLALRKLQANNSVAGAAVFANPNIPTAFAQTVQSNALGINDLDINTNVAGKLEIPSLKITVPIIWSKTPDSFNLDLQNGVVHYPGTAMPGQIGTTYISGHSSNYVWAKGSYNRVFSTLGDLKTSSGFDITVTLNSGKQAVLHYVITGSKEYSPTDQAQFANSGKSVVALSTCWPVGSTAKRLVVFGELTQIDRPQ